VRAVALLAWIALAAGCASPRYLYEHPSATPARLDHDYQECRRQAVRPDVFSITRDGRYDSDVVNRCMEQKGYRVTRDG
jgi:hypothetical protein